MPKTVLITLSDIEAAALEFVLNLTGGVGGFLKSSVESQTGENKVAAGFDLLASYGLYPPPTNDAELAAAIKTAKAKAKAEVKAKALEEVDKKIDEGLSLLERELNQAESAVNQEISNAETAISDAFSDVVSDASSLQNELGIFNDNLSKAKGKIVDLGKIG